MPIKSTANIIMTLFLVSVIALIVKPVNLSNEQSYHNLSLSSSQQQDQQSIISSSSSKDNTLTVSLLADNLENRLNKSAAILEITSKLPEVKNLTYASSLNQTLRTLHGIGRDLDIQKRKVAQNILSADKDFGVIFFLMPNGNVYMEEPYSRQLNLTKTNLDFRDFYKGSVSTHMTYLGNVVISASSGLQQANIAVPIYSGETNNKSLVGIWAGGLNLRVFSKSLQSLNLTNNERIVYVDYHGQKIADSDKKQGINKKNESFANLQSFKNAVAGKTGSIIEIINGTKMIVSYHPVNAIQTRWVILDIRPYESNTFAPKI
jgi:cache domain-containing protein